MPPMSTDPNISSPQAVNDHIHKISKNIDSPQDFNRKSSQALNEEKSMVSQDETLHLDSKFSKQPEI